MQHMMSGRPIPDRGRFRRTHHTDIIPRRPRR